MKSPAQMIADHADKVAAMKVRHDRRVESIEAAYAARIAQLDNEIRNRLDALCDDQLLGIVNADCSLSTDAETLLAGRVATDIALGMFVDAELVRALAFRVIHQLNNPQPTEQQADRIESGRV